MKNQLIKKIFLSPWTALITLSVIVSIRIVDPAFIESIRLRFFDTLILSKEETETEIYTVNIDEEALAQFGQWPLPRGEYAKLIEELYKREAGLVVFNVLMPNPDRSQQDNVLAATLAKLPVILPSAPSDQTRNEPKNPGSAVLSPEYMDRIVQYPGLIANVPLLENNATGVGIVNTLPEIDGVNRRVPLVITVNGKIYPSLSLETLRVLADDNTIQIKLNENGVEKMRIPKYGPIATDSLGRIWIDWSQRTKSFSITNLPQSFNNGLVVVGVTAAGLSNPVPTSKGAVYPHEAQAGIIATMINEVTILRPDYADGLEIVAIVIAGILLLILTRWTYVGLISIIVLVGGAITSSWYLFSNFLWLFDSTAFTGGTILVALHAYGIKFISEFLQKQQIKKQFGSYVNPVIVERLQKNPDLIKLGGEEKILSVVMTDMRNFTGLGERYGKDVEGFTAIMNAYMTAISKPVFANDGCLIKFIGDASLHIHGAPLDDDRHAYRAVKTTIEMIKAVEDFNKHLASIDKPPVGMGAGINTGKILVGNIGSEGKIGYDVLGDPVSVASRLEGQTKGYGVLVIIGPDTYKEVDKDFFCLELDCIAVKGKAEGLNIYTPLLHTNVNDLTNYQLAAEEHNKMLSLYRLKKFDQAIDLCKNLMGKFDGQMDHYYDLWIERCKEMATMNLPDNWDGIYRATSK